MTCRRHPLSPLHESAPGSPRACGSASPIHSRAASQTPRTPRLPHPLVLWRGGSGSADGRWFRSPPPGEVGPLRGTPAPSVDGVRRTNPERVPWGITGDSERRICPGVPKGCGRRPTQPRQKPRSRRPRSHRHTGQTETGGDAGASPPAGRRLRCVLNPRFRARTSSRCRNTCGPDRRSARSRHCTLCSGTRPHQCA